MVALGHWKLGPGVLKHVCSLFEDIILSFTEDDPFFYKDCLQIYEMGNKASGVYMIDPTGEDNPKQAVQVYCDRGWTTILKRGEPEDQSVRQVRNEEMYLFVVAFLHQVDVFHIPGGLFRKEIIRRV